MRPRDCLNSVFVLCFTRVWVTSETISESKGLSQLNVCVVFHKHLSDIRVPGVRPRDCRNSMFTLCFTCTCIWATSGYHKWGRGTVSSQCLYYVFHAFERHQDTISEDEELSQPSVCFTRIRATPGNYKWNRGILSSECLYCVLYAFERRQGTISEAEALSQLNVCIVLTLIWATSGYHRWGRGVISSQWRYCFLHVFERHQGTISEAEGLSCLNVCIAIYTHCELVGPRRSGEQAGIMFHFWVAGPEAV